MTGESEASGKYCQLTLKRQLDTGKFEGGITTWCENVVQLSGFHLGQGRYAKAAHCLLAAAAVLVPEAADNPGTVANIHWAWGKIYLQRLRDERDRLRALEAGAVPNEPAPLEAKFDVSFDELSLPAGPNDYIAPVESYEAACRCAKRGFIELGKAKEYYVLDGFVTEHVQVRPVWPCPWRFRCGLVHDGFNAALCTPRSDTLRCRFGSCHVIDGLVTEHVRRVL